MSAVHIKIENTDGGYTCKVRVFIGGAEVNRNYFSRNLVKVTPKPLGGGYIVVSFVDGSSFQLTNNQESTIDDIYIVDEVNGVAPTSLLDLADKINEVVKF